jgi:hypothetical protein
MGTKVRAIIIPHLTAFDGFCVLVFNWNDGSPFESDDVKDVCRGWYHYFSLLAESVANNIKSFV